MLLLWNGGVGGGGGGVVVGSLPIVVTVAGVLFTVTLPIAGTWAAEIKFWKGHLLMRWCGVLVWAESAEGAQAVADGVYGVCRKKCRCARQLC